MESARWMSTSKSHKELMSVGQIEKRSGIPVSTLHFYEKKGLIKCERNKGNQRRYPRHTLRILAVIRIAQSLGLSLTEIKFHLDTLPHQGPPSVADWKRLSSRWHKDLDHRIQQMTILRDKLTSCIGCGCLSVTECPLRNPNDKASEIGPGPSEFNL